MHFPTAGTSYDLVALASSAGGLNALTEVLSALPASFPAMIVIVQHMLPTRKTMLPELLNYRTQIPIKLAEEHDLLQPGMAYVAPPDFHLLVYPDQTLSLSHSVREAYVRPSADVLFRSAAESFGARVIGVILSGTGKDGSSGVCAIHAAGGHIIVQNQETSDYYGMSQSAILTGCVDDILPLEQIPAALLNLVRTGSPP